MNDWKGNEIKEGYEIVVIRTRRVFWGTYFYDHNKDKEVCIVKPSEEEIWEPWKPMRVFKDERGELCVKEELITDTYHAWCTHTLKELTVWFDGTTIIAIKGLSDKKD